MLLRVIVACEIGFWVILLAGLVARYLLRLPRLGLILLACVPLVDLVLLIATIISLRGGETASVTHGLAAVYIGFSVAFGHGMIRWADERFAHRFADGPPPSKPPEYGRARTAYEWREFRKAAIAWAIGCTLLYAGVLFVGDPTRTGALMEWIGQLTVVLAIWLIWPISYTIWPKKPKEGEVAKG